MKSAFDRGIEFLQSRRRLPSSNLLVTRRFVVTLLREYSTEEAKKLAKEIEKEKPVKTSETKEETFDLFGDSIYDKARSSK